MPLKQDAISAVGRCVHVGVQKELARIIAIGRTQSRTPHFRLHHDTMRCQRTVHQRMHPSLSHTLLRYQFQGACMLMIRECRPEYIDGNRADVVPQLIVHSLRRSTSAASERHSISSAI